MKEEVVAQTRKRDALVCYLIYYADRLLPFAILLSIELSPRQ